MSFQLGNIIVVLVMSMFSLSNTCICKSKCDSYIENYLQQVKDEPEPPPEVDNWDLEMPMKLLGLCIVFPPNPATIKMVEPATWAEEAGLLGGSLWNENLVQGRGFRCY